MARSGGACDVLFRADIAPLKRGSFEDYLEALQQRCRAEDIAISFLLLDDGTGRGRSVLRGLPYDVLSEEEQSSPRAFAARLRKMRPRLLHHNFTPFCSTELLAARALGIAQVFTEHTSPPARSGGETGAWEAVKRLRRSFYAGQVVRYIAVSRFVADHLVAVAGVPRTKIDLIYNGVNVERFAPSADRREALRQQLLAGTRLRQIVTYVGQLRPEKGVSLLLDSVPRISSRHADTLFLIAGAGPDRAELERSVPEEARSRVRFLGVRDDVEALMNASDIFVCPSTWDEAFGLTAAEAMACGLPVVASNAGGLPEVVQDRVTGIVIPRNDAPALADAVTTLLDNERLRRELGGAGAQRVRSLFGLDQMVTRTVRLYQEVLQPR